MAPKNVINLTRTDAATLIEDVRKALAWRDKSAAGSQTADETLALIREALNLAGLPSLELCNGEAHSNAFIDSCGVCAPRWGLTGAPVKIR